MSKRWRIAELRVMHHRNLQISSFEKNLFAVVRQWTNSYLSYLLSRVLLKLPCFLGSKQSVRSAYLFELPDVDEFGAKKLQICGRPYLGDWQEESVAVTLPRQCCDFVQANKVHFEENSFVCLTVLRSEKTVNHAPHTKSPLHNTWLWCHLEDFGKPRAIKGINNNANFWKYLLVISASFQSLEFLVTLPQVSRGGGANLKHGILFASVSNTWCLVFTAVWYGFKVAVDDSFIFGNTLGKIATWKDILFNTR